MKIKEITWQQRRDFNCIYICEHCDHEEKGDGYDDHYFHTQVIPERKCGKCGKIAPKDYKPKATKYPQGYII